MQMAGKTGVWVAESKEFRQRWKGLDQRSRNVCCLGLYVPACVSFISLWHAQSLSSNLFLACRVHYSGLTSLQGKWSLIVHAFIYPSNSNKSVSYYPIPFKALQETALPQLIYLSDCQRAFSSSAKQLILIRGVCYKGCRCSSVFRVFSFI